MSTRKGTRTGNGTGATCILTGVSGGIGQAILQHVAGKVEHVITCSRRGIEEFWRGKWPSNARHIQLDLTRVDNISRLFDGIIGGNNNVKMVVNCVGGSLYSHLIEDFPETEYDMVMDVNLKSAFFLTKYAILKMKETGGNIVHVVSSSAKKTSSRKAPYGIAKAGLAHLIHYAAVEAAGYNIKVNGISPTYVFTPRHERDIEEKMEKTGKTRDEIVSKIVSPQLLKRPMHPGDLVDVAWLLATTNSITGQVFNCTMGEILSY
ncbi:MAG: SDR family NAD(P)-dependent oxidoreductase [Promethearchaeota archaeon]